MTPKQIERIQNKIKRIRKEIYDEKRQFGGYHDGRGLRYIPFELYLKIQDFKGALTYLRWFIKNFPDDLGMPDIMFMASFIYFKNNKIKDAEKKAIQTYFAEPLTFDIFFERPIMQNEESNLDFSSFKDFFSDLKKQNNLTEFQNWLTEFEKSETYNKYKSNYHELKSQLRKNTDERASDDLLDKLLELERLEKY